MKIEVYGASDDLIEIDGDISDEFSAGDDRGMLGFSDGTLLSIRYDAEGFWRINVVARGTASYSKVEGVDADKNYSDKVTLEGDVFWVLYGSHFTEAGE